MRITLIAALTFVCGTAEAEPIRIMVTPIQTSTTHFQIPQKELTQVVAETTAVASGHTTVTEEDVLAALEQIRRRYEVGCEEEACLVELGGMVDAAQVVSTSLGLLGQRVLATASLLEVAEQRVSARSSLVFDGRQLKEALPVLIKRLFGRPAQLDPLYGAEPEVNRALSELIRQVAAETRSRSPHELDRLACLPFVERGAAQGRDLGNALAEITRDSLTTGHGLRLVDEDRIAELRDQQELEKVARFLGANLLLRGVVSDLGNHYLLRLTLTDENAKTVWTGRTALPRGPGLSELAEQALVRRTRSGAIFRAVVGSGWGQFYNDEPVKGGLVLGGVLAGLGTMTVALILSNEKRIESQEVEQLCEPGDPARCKAKVQPLEDDATVLRNVAIGAAIAAGVIHLLGVVDAGLSAEDHSDTLLALIPTPDTGLALVLHW